MALQGLFWPDISRRDIHLLPGSVSPRIDQLLAIEDSLGNTLASTPKPGVAVTFAPRFFGAPASHGVTVSTVTGQVTIANPLPAAPFLRNFIIDCTATEGATQFTRMIRIHVHPGIRRHWVTPARLNVPLGARSMRLSMLAEFTDDTFGDLTNWGAFDPPGPGQDQNFVQTDTTPRRPALRWSSNSPGLTVDARTGVLNALVMVAGGAQITATLDAAFGQPQRTVVVNGVPAWSTATPVSHIAGPLARMADADVQNFLILPEGFGAGDRAAFEQLADSLVNKLQTQEPLTPWSILDHKMNYFRAWVPSPEAGLTILNEVQRFNKAAPNADAFEFDQPRVPGAGTAPLAAMIHSVGLPVPVDDPDGNPMVNKVLLWTGLYGAAAVLNTSVVSYPATGSPSFPGWLDLNDRVVLNERATAFHIAMGERPAAELGSENRAIDRHPMRVSVQDLDDFLRNLEDRPGHKVGAVWVVGGKDHGNVLFLCRTNHFGGSNASRSLPANPAVVGRLICIAIGNDSRHRIAANAGGNGFDIRPDPIPAAAGPQVWTRAAHEYAHSLGLEDEYGDRRGGRYADTPAHRANVGRAANVQMRQSLLVAGSLDGGSIKWRWPRIRRAGVLTGPPAPLGGNRFRLTLQAGQSQPFITTGDAKGRLADIVRLRTRPLLTAGPSSIRFKVIAKAANTIDIEPVPPGGAFAAANFPARSIVFAGRRAPDPDFANNVLGDDLELLSVKARDRIAASHNPLNAAHNAAANRACTAQNVAPHLPTKSANWPPPGGAPKPPKYSSWIAGLYEGGVIHDCDVYHPTGICLMRTKTFQAGASAERSYQFCPVCRYAMVDLLDPTLHGVMDDLYQPRYPV